jgi:stage V sporulation protein G
VEITEVRIKLMDDPHDRLQGFCSITFDSKFVIRDLKIIQGGKGSFVAMPSRKLTDRCPRCNTKNHLRALYCNQCGTRLSEDRAEKDYDGRAKLYADIAHPINSECREQIQQEVLKAFELEIVRAKQPGYVCTYDDYGEDNYAAVDEEYEAFVAGSSRGPKRDEAARRIEPAVSQPAGPHHNLAARTREKTATAASHRTASSQSDDEFGTGL